MEFTFWFPFWSRETPYKLVQCGITDGKKCCAFKAKCTEGRIESCCLNGLVREGLTEGTFEPTPEGNEGESREAP